MMHRPWSSIVEVPYCFSRSNVKFQGHTALKIVKSYRNWAFLDSNSSLNSLMVMKCCTKLETAKERCPIVFQSHPSNFNVTRDKTSPLLTRIGRFRTIGRSQLSNPSDLPCSWKSAWKWQVYPWKIKHPDILLFFSCDQAAIWLVQSVRLSVCLSVCPSVRHTFFTMFPSSYHHEIFRSYYQWQKWRPCKRLRSEVKGQGHRGQHPT